MSNATIEFPSDKACEKFPRIVVDGDANDIIRWINEHREIDRRVPPVFPDWFVLDLTPNGYHVVICAKYSEDKTAFIYRAAIDGIRAVIAELDYSSLDDDGSAPLDSSYSSKAREKYAEEWLDQFAIFCTNMLIAVQAYILYHQPKVIEQVVDVSAPRKTTENSTKKKKTKKNNGIKIKNTVRKLIRVDPKVLPPREYKYKKLAWNVRGHYRHVGKEKKLKYIAPFTCNRGGAKNKPKVKTYIIEEPKKQEP